MPIALGSKNTFRAKYLFNRSIDTGMVRYIAEQNPLMLGNLVYSARTLLGVEVEDSLGIAQGPSNKLQGNFIQGLEVFPNPSAGLIQIQGTKGLAEVQVYDLTGALVYAETQVQSSFDIAHLPLGVYLVRIQTNETIYVGKVQLIK